MEMERCIIRMYCYSFEGLLNTQVGSQLIPPGTVFKGQ